MAVTTQMGHAIRVGIELNLNLSQGVPKVYNNYRRGCSLHRNWF